MSLSDGNLPGLVVSLLEMDTEKLWSEIVDAGPAVRSVGLKPDLEAHLDMLAREFSGQTAAAFLHAALAVLIRRRTGLEHALGRFFEMWDNHGVRLAAALNSRWLVSAMDTFVDHGRSSEERAQALAGTLLMNTVKLYETEREFTGQRARAETCPASYARADLDDGMSTFVVGYGDMVRNLTNRAQRFRSGPTGLIMQTLLDRLLVGDTVFRRFRSVHLREETRW